MKDHVQYKRTFAPIAKTEHYTDRKTGKAKRRWPISKNEVHEALLRQVAQNHIPFRDVLNDVWNSSADNTVLVKHPLKKEFIMPLKATRKVARTWDDKLHGALCEGRNWDPNRTLGLRCIRKA